MAEAEDRELKVSLEAALAAAETAGDTLIAAKMAECLWILSRRTDHRDG